MKRIALRKRHLLAGARRDVVLGLGTLEIVLVGLALILLFGPEHAPRAMHTLGRWQAKVRRLLGEAQETLEREVRGPVEYPALPPSVSGEIPEDRD